MVTRVTPRYMARFKMSTIPYIWKKGSTPIKTSSSSRVFIELVSTKFAIRFSWVNMTPFDSPVVPLEYGSATKSIFGSILTSGATPSLSRSWEKGVAPSASPSTKISLIPHAWAAGSARSINAGMVIKIFALESLN